MRRRPVLYISYTVILLVIKVKYSISNIRIFFFLYLVIVRDGSALVRDVPEISLLERRTSKTGS